MVTATCHPDRKHHAKGLCYKCWRQRRDARPEAIARRKAYAQTEASQAWFKDYEARPETKARDRELRARPESKLTRSEQNRAYRRTAHGRAIFFLTQAKARARKRGYSSDLTIDDVGIPERCPVFGIPLDVAAETNADNLPSIDRKDPSKGYVKGNVWVISWRANRLKNNATLEELKMLVAALEHQRARAFRAKAHAWFRRSA